MAKRKKTYKITSKQRFDFGKPKYNGFLVGYGPHGSTKYNRSKSKRDFKRGIDDYE